MPISSPSFSSYLISSSVNEICIALAAYSRYYSEDAYTAANEPKELVIVPGADHVDLYDNMSKIPFDKLERFFKDNLK